MTDLPPPTARYQQVANLLREAIERGDYAPGEQLPSESTLARQYHLTRTTINRAMRALETAGLVTIMHGSGTYVREQQPLIHVSAAYTAGRATWSAELENQGLVGDQRIEYVGPVRPAQDIAAWLGLGDGGQAVVRRRTMMVGGTPVQLADSYYPMELADGTELADPARMPGGTIAALERLGVQIVTFRERIRTRLPTPGEVEALRMSPGIPVFRHIRVTYATRGVVEVSETIMRGDRHELDYELPADIGPA